MRHGETQANAQGRYQGRLDSDLTDRGLAQAQAVSALLADRLRGRAVRILVSPLGRAQKTAAILAAALDRPRPVQTLDTLTEVSMGACEGLTRAEIAQHWPNIRKGRARREWMFHTPGGETLDVAFARASAAYAQARASDEPTVIVSHAILGRLIRAAHGQQPVLEALALEAPQEVAFQLGDGGHEHALTAL